MIVQEILSPLSNDTKRLDRILVELCDMILAAQKKNPTHYGLVAACVVDPKGKQATGINHVVNNDKRVHAERDAVRNYTQTHGELPDGCLMITTLSPCTEHTGEMAQERAGISCSELIDELNIHRVYCGYLDPTQDLHTQHNNFDCVETQNEKIQHVCREIADCFLKETSYNDPANYCGEGVNEDFFNGIEISIEKDDDEIMIKAMSNGRELGHVLFVQEGEYLLPQDLEVDERYQGQGIAAVMYDYVKKQGYKIRRSGQQTAAGAGFWNKHKPGKNIWEQGVAEGATKIHSDKEPKLTGFSFQQLDSLCESAGSDYVKFDRAIKKNLVLPAWTNTLELYGVYARKLNEVKSKTLAEGTQSDIEQQLFDQLSQRALGNIDSASVGDRVSLLHLATLNIPGHKVVAKLNGFLTPKQIVKIVNTGRFQQLEFADGSRYPEKDGGDIFQQTQAWNMTKLFPSADAASKAFMFYVLEGQKLSDVLDFQTNVDQGVAENFADGKNPGRKGLAKRSGVNMLTPKQV